jgi:type VI secretion system protein VasI
VRATTARLLVCLALACLQGVSVAGATDQELLAALTAWNTAAQTCRGITDGAQRLACYDAMAATFANTIAGMSVLQGVGKWQSTSQSNPLDDTKTVVFALEADSGASAWGKKAVLVLRCRSGVTEAYVSWGDYLGDETSVTWRVGSALATTAEWSMSTDKEATFFPSQTYSLTAGPRTPLELVRALLAADQFVAQITPYLESTITAVFDIRGLSEAVRSLQVPCGWL